LSPGGAERPGWKGPNALGTVFRDLHVGHSCDSVSAVLLGLVQADGISGQIPAGLNGDDIGASASKRDRKVSR
jgi:hypothetical protein